MNRPETFNLAERLLFEMQHRPRRLTGSVGKKMSAQDQLTQLRQVKRLRDLLTRATKFKLDREFTLLTEQVSVLPAARIKPLFRRARAPYDLTWLEWDESDRLEGRGDFDPRTPLGVLIERLTAAESETLYRLHFFTGPIEGFRSSSNFRVGVDPLGWVYDTEMPLDDWPLTETDRELQRVSAAAPGHWLFEKRYENLRTWVGWGPEWVEENCAARREDDDDQYVQYGPDLYPLIAGTRMFIEPYYIPTIVGLDRHLRAGWRLPARYKDTIRTGNDVLDAICHQVYGSLRWAITAIGLVNVCDHVMDQGYFENERGERQVIGGRRAKFLDYWTLSLKAPRKYWLDKLQEPTRPGEGGSKRAHEVMGHWCLGRRTGRSWWRNSHWRGNARLGVVHKNYRVGRSDYLPEEIQEELARDD